MQRDSTGSAAAASARAGLPSMTELHHAGIQHLAQPGAAGLSAPLQETCKDPHWQSPEASPNLPSREWAGRTLYVPVRLSATTPGDQKGRGEVIKEPSKPKTKCFGQGAGPQSPSAASAFICKRARRLLLHWGTNCTCYKQPESLPCSWGDTPAAAPRRDL